MRKGAPTSLDVSDANATSGDVKSPATFYAGTPERKVGSIVTRTLDPANENVPEGWYAATTLSAVDGDLVIGSIKSGITIFGVTGPATVQDISGADALVGDVRTGKTFFSVTGAEKTGTVDPVSIVAGSENVPAGIHTATTLSAIDADLVAANIRDGIVIFGITGTLEEGGTPIFDDADYDGSSNANQGTQVAYGESHGAVASGGDHTLFSKGITLDINSVVFASCGGAFRDNWDSDGCKLRLYIDGVQQAESGFIASAWNYANSPWLIGDKDCSSGARTVSARVHNYHATTATLVYSMGYVAGHVSKE